MANVQIKSEKLTPFGRIFPIMEQFDALLAQTIDSTISTIHANMTTIALLSIIFYYSCWIPRNNHIIGERATHNASSTNHDILSQCRTF